MSLRDHAGPLRQLNFRRFFLGEVINTAGSSMSGIALAFAVLHIENSATTLGWVVAAATIPMVTFMLLGGAVADRFPRALVLRGCNVAQGLVQAIAAVLVLTGAASVWHLVLLQFVSGTAFAASYPAFHGMVPILLPVQERKAAYLLINQTESDIPRVNQPSLDRLKELNAQWVTLKARGVEILDRDIPAFNKRLWDAGLGAIWKDS